MMMMMMVLKEEDEKKAKHTKIVCIPPNTISHMTTVAFGATTGTGNV